MCSQIAKPKIAHLILAAGSSSRMGSPKQLLPWKNTTLIGYAMQQSIALEELDTYVILGANYDLIKKEINDGLVTIIKNSNWQSGMGSSISVGVRTIQQSSYAYDALLISLIDQPLIEVNYLQLLITEYKKSTCDLAASDLGDRVGVPAIFSSSLFEELITLNEDYGARHIITKHKNSSIIISAKEKGIDIDTKEEYKALMNNTFPK